MRENNPENDVRSVASGVRLRVLIPLFIALILLLLTFVSIFFREARKRQGEDIARTAASVEDMFKAQSVEGVQVMRSIMELVMRDRRLEEALRARDRQALLDISEPILKDIRGRNRITHFYYILPDRTMLLRVQVPDKYGDRIDRFVLQEAQRTGKPFWGNEQGPFGSLTLRVTYPWYSKGEVIGYLEMGIEFEDIMQAFHKMLDVDVFVAIDKKFMDRAKWESMRKRTGGEAQWDEFPSVIVLSRTRPEIPAPIAAYLAGLKDRHIRRTFQTAWGGRVSETVVVPFADLRGRELGELVVLRDITRAASERRQGLILIATLCTLIGGVLMAFFYVLLGRVQRDVAERTARLTEAQGQLLDAREELARKEKLAILGQLSGSVGHELRNPLGVMNNAVYFLKMVLAEADETVQEYLEIVEKEIANSLRIITDLLDFAQTKAPQIKAVTLRELVDESLGRCAIPDNVALETDMPDSLPLLGVDPLQMVQVLANLITNAVQAMPGGGSLRIGAREIREFGFEAESGTRPPMPEGNFVEISVTDTGEGIATENMQKLFHPLFTTKPKGIGLGLVICRNLTEANGGRIEVESEPGKGTTFTVLLQAQGSGR